MCLADLITLVGTEGISSLRQIRRAAFHITRFWKDAVGRTPNWMLDGNLRLLLRIPVLARQNEAIRTIISEIAQEAPGPASYTAQRDGLRSLRSQSETVKGRRNELASARSPLPAITETRNFCAAAVKTSTDTALSPAKRKAHSMSFAEFAIDIAKTSGFSPNKKATKAWNIPLLIEPRPIKERSIARSRSKPCANWQTSAATAAMPIVMLL